MARHLHYFRRPPKADPASPHATSRLEPLSTWQAVGLVVVGFLVGLLVAFCLAWWYLAVYRR